MSLFEKKKIGESLEKERLPCVTNSSLRQNTGQCYEDTCSPYPSKEKLNQRDNQALASNADITS